MSGDETKLPKWAQQELYRLRCTVSALEQAITIASQQAPKEGATGKVIADYLAERPFPLKDRSMVRFQVGPGRYDTITCVLRERGKNQVVLDVNAQNGTLVIHPTAANCANLAVGNT